jgi:large-conductance mechanosensitive channel
MISFLVQEGVLTVGTISGIFTVYMLNSLKQNVLDPVCEQIIENSELSSHFSESSNVNPQPSKTIKWKHFLKDFIIWICLMVALYLFWKFVIYPIKGATPAQPNPVQQNGLDPLGLKINVFGKKV